MTVKWWTSKRLYVLIGALLLTFVAGATASTVYALFGPDHVDAMQFNVTYVGVTAPADSISDGSFSLVLGAMDGAITQGQSSEMTVDFIKNSFTGIKLLSNRSCDSAGTNLGWCVQGETKAWTVMPQAVLPTILVDGVTVMWGPGYIREIGGAGMQGLATYRVTLQQPADPATEGLVVTINAHGFVNKIGGPIPDTGPGPGPTPTPSPFENFVLNPGFENGSTNWEQTSFGGRSIVDNQSHSGESSQRMLASRRLKRLVSQEVSIIPGETYDASAWIKTQDLDRTGACVEFIWLKVAGASGTPHRSKIIKVNTLGPIAGSNDWTQISLTGLTAPESAVAVRVNLWMERERGGSGMAWFDDIALLEPPSSDGD